MTVEGAGDGNRQDKRDPASEPSPPSLAETELALLKQTASVAEEAARWLRNGLQRVQSGHDIEFELRNAEQALGGALETIRGLREAELADADTRSWS